MLARSKKGLRLLVVCTPQTHQAPGGFPKLGSPLGLESPVLSDLGVLQHQQPRCLPTLAVWKWAERKTAVKQMKADMQVASFPFRLQSLEKMLILEGSKRMLALIWTTLRDLGGERGPGGRCSSGHPRTAQQPPGGPHVSRGALSTPFPKVTTRCWPALSSAV